MKTVYPSKWLDSYRIGGGSTPTDLRMAQKKQRLKAMVWTIALRWSGYQPEGGNVEL